MFKKLWKSVKKWIVRIVKAEAKKWVDDDPRG